MSLYQNPDGADVFVQEVVELDEILPLLIMKTSKRKNVKPSIVSLVMVKITSVIKHYYVRFGDNEKKNS